MCQRLYIASRKKLKTQKRGKSSPFLSVQDLGDADRVREHFGPDREHLYLAGAHVVCGCGFPAVQADGSGRDDRVEPEDLQSKQALAEHLRDACRGNGTIELYLCWTHEESEPPLGRRTVSLRDLRDPAFRLRHRELLTVGRAP